MAYKNTPNVDKFKFTGKEELPLTGYTDFGARWYDNLVPRFISIDPLAETSRRWSPYTYAFNSPLMFIDPDGMENTGLPEQQPQNNGFEYSDGYQTHNSRESTGAIDFDGAYLNAGGDGGSSNRDDKPKVNSKKTLPTVEQATKNGLNPNGDGIEPDYTIEGLYISQKTFNALGKTLGKFWRGIFGKAAGGAWVTTNESMSLAAAEYQTFITGRAANESYLLRGVKFDGLIDDVLVDAKSGYGNFVDKSTGGFHRWFSGAKSLLEQAERQSGAANGAKIQWYFQNNAAMQATQKLFNKEGVKGIELIFKSN